MRRLKPKRFFNSKNMSQYPGKFIVIDGTDGSGKTTQLQLLANKLSQEGYDLEFADFPQYNSKSAGMVEEYLSGKYGNDAENVSPYAASLFYAVDRFDASFQIRQWLQAGKIVIANRYISSSFAHQGGKIENPLERKMFFNWLSEIEYKVFNIPQPDLYLILHVEAEISQKLAIDRKREDWHGKTKDIHEEDINHLKKAEKIYLEIAQELSNFRLVKCTRNGEIMNREDIHYLIWLHVKRLFDINENQSHKYGFQAVSDILSKKNKLAPALPFEQAANHHIPEQSPDTINSDTPATTKLEVTNTLQIERIHPEAKLPSRAHPQDAGLDIYACENISIPPYSQAAIATGLKLAIPQGFVGLIWDKSGLALQGYTTLGGVIDANYRGELKIIFKNLSEDIYHVASGQKIAQLLIQKIETPLIEETSLEDQTSRGEAGFGSTGLN